MTRNELVEIRMQISQLSGKLVDISTGLFEMSQKIDKLLMENAELPYETEYYEPKPRRNAPEPPETAHTARSFKRMPEPQPEPQPMPEPIPVRQEPPKPNMVERLLGKDIDQRQKDRAARMAQLEKELADLNAKK
jgi:regulator of replication initiation timing